MKSRTIRKRLVRKRQRVHELAKNTIGKRGAEDQQNDSAAMIPAEIPLPIENIYPASRSGYLEAVAAARRLNEGLPPPVADAATDEPVAPEQIADFNSASPLAAESVQFNGEAFLSGSASSQSLSELENDNARLQKELSKLRREKREDEKNASHAEIKYAALLDQLSSLKKKERIHLRNLARFKKSESDFKRQLSQITGSFSWRMTAPLRKLSQAISKSPEQKSEPAPSTRRAKNLEEALWGGFSARALRELEDTANSTNGRASDRVDAILALANWHNAEAKYDSAKRFFDQLRSIGSYKPSQAQILAEAFCLTRIGRGDEARGLLLSEERKFKDSASFSLAISNSYIHPTGDEAADDIRLHWINQVFDTAGIASLTKKDPSQPLTVNNLSTMPVNKVSAAENPLVSIIIPAYNGETALPLALDSLIEQSWENIEVLVVDDYSTDSTAELVEEYTRKDTRIRLLRQPKNQGSYSARNRGLLEATGDLLTIHDAGDWSHPQKIEIQARHLLKSPKSIGNYSRWARVYDDLLFAGKFRRKDRLIDWNPSSFLFYREFLDFAGGWDAVRISADAELIRRAAKLLPDQPVKSAFDDAPLAFGVEDEASLTKHSRTHGRTIYHGFRREYRESADHWLKVSSKEALKLDIATRPRPFPVPGPIRPDREDSIECDTVIIADFNAAPQLVQVALEIIDVALEAERKVGVFHWPHYSSDVTKVLNATIRKMAHEGLLRIISPGERVITKKAIVAHPTVLLDAIDLCPSFTADSILVVNDGGAPASRNSDAEFDVDTGRANLAKIFQSEGEWVALPAALRAVAN